MRRARLDMLHAGQPRPGALGSAHGAYPEDAPSPREAALRAGGHLADGLRRRRDPGAPGARSWPEAATRGRYVSARPRLRGRSVCLAERDSAPRKAGRDALGAHLGVLRRSRPYRAIRQGCARRPADGESGRRSRCYCLAVWSILHRRPDSSVRHMRRPTRACVSQHFREVHVPAGGQRVRVLGGQVPLDRFYIGLAEAPGGADGHAAAQARQQVANVVLNACGVPAARGADFRARLACSAPRVHGGVPLDNVNVPDWCGHWKVPLRDVGGCSKSNATAGLVSVQQ